MANNQNLASTLAEFKRKAQLTAVAKWTRASLATAFTSWRQHVRAAKRSRAAEEETQARLQQMQQQYESEKQTLIDGSARAREKVALKMISRMTSASMESCFRAWRQCVVHSRQERQEQSRLHQLQLEFEQEKKALLVSADDQQQKVYEKVLKQWNKKTVGDAMERKVGAWSWGRDQQVHDGVVLCCVVDAHAGIGSILSVASLGPKLQARANAARCGLTEARAG